MREWEEVEKFEGTVKFLVHFNGGGCSTLRALTLVLVSSSVFFFFLPQTDPQMF